MTQYYFKRLLVTNQPCILKATASSYIPLGEHPTNDTCLQYKGVSTPCFWQTVQAVLRQTATHKICTPGQGAHKSNL